MHRSSSGAGLFSCSFSANCEEEEVPHKGSVKLKSLHQSALTQSSLRQLQPQQYYNQVQHKHHCCVWRALSSRIASRPVTFALTQSLSPGASGLFFPRATPPVATRLNCWVSSDEIRWPQRRIRLGNTIQLWFIRIFTLFRYVFHIENSTSQQMFVMRIFSEGDINILNGF